MDAQQFAKLLETFNKSQEILLQQIAQTSQISSTSRPGQSQATVSSVVLIPNFENFNASKENFKMYRQRFENYLTMKGVFNDKILSSQMLLNSIGPNHYQLIVSLLSPENPKDFPYDELLQKLKNHLCPKKNVLVAQHQFLSLYQLDNQSIADFVVQLRRNVSDCDFVSPCKCEISISDMFLRAQFIRGLKDNSIREQILQSNETSFEEIVKKSLAIEAAKIDSRLLGSKQPSVLDSSIASDINK